MCKLCQRFIEDGQLCVNHIRDPYDNGLPIREDSVTSSVLIILLIGLGRSSKIIDLVLLTLKTHAMLRCLIKFLLELSFEYIKYNGGLETEEAYPYTGSNDLCKFTSENVAVKVLGSVNITLLDETYDMLTSKRPCGPNKKADTGAMYDLAKNDL
ncbi:unnamed protein product [Vicia faba]|uniref:Peptidase C1A papain C-terminal domain-containing protein n=1 Tax=Vicia faba TaxID=3906 RepID=A0AAV0ZB74_VICFA|nr:unnamed protein product [Vicia faba]